MKFTLTSATCTHQQQYLVLQMLEVDSVEFVENFRDDAQTSALVFPEHVAAHAQNERLAVGTTLQELNDGNLNTANITEHECYNVRSTCTCRYGTVIFYFVSQHGHDSIETKLNTPKTTCNTKFKLRELHAQASVKYRNRSCKRPGGA